MYEPWKTDLGRPKLDAGLALDKRGGDLQDDGLDGVGGGSALLGQQLHADGATAQHVASRHHGVDYPHKRRVKGEQLLVEFEVL